jgi:hypothetical protein
LCFIMEQMKNIFLIGFTIICLKSFCQDCNECESRNYVIDTNEVINKIRLRHQFLTNLKQGEFDYIYKQQLENGCNEADEITKLTYYINNETGIVSEQITGSGEGGYYSNSSINKYFQNDRLIFEYKVISGTSMNHINESYIEESRTYYDNCGQIIRRLYKRVNGSDLKPEETLESRLQSTKNSDLTKK